LGGDENQDQEGRPPVHLRRVAGSSAAVDNGWLDIVALPVVDSSRVFRELDWSPSVVAMTVIREVHSGMCHRDAGATPALRRRSVSGAMRDLVTRGPVGQRNRP
jgi:UDP-glucose 4-epimerase